MNLPGFTAASSLYRRGDGYPAAARFESDHERAGKVVPQDCCSKCYAAASRCSRACRDIRAIQGPAGLGAPGFACIDRCSAITDTCLAICDAFGGCGGGGSGSSGQYPGGWPPAL